MSAEPAALELDDKFHDECGLFGVWNHAEAANVTYLGLYALQHRGQESAGIAATDGDALPRREGDGLGGRRVQPRAAASALPGHRAIGHVRYSTAGSSNLRNAQPITGEDRARAGRHRPQRQPRQRRGAARGARAGRRHLPVHLRHRGHPPPARAGRGRDAWSSSSPRALTRVKGAYSLLLLTPDGMIGVRDPSGFRPLTLGRLGDTWVLASETCALDLMEAKIVRDVEPGEILVDRRAGAALAQAVPPRRAAAVRLRVRLLRAPRLRAVGPQRPRACARRSATSSRASIRSRPTSSSRCPTPASGAALGYSEESGIPYDMRPHPQPLRRAAPSSSRSRASATSASR